MDLERGDRASGSKRHMCVVRTFALVARLRLFHSLSMK
jgi:hypothetical protein